MRHCGSWPIAVCSWSLQAPLTEVVTRLRDWEVGSVHLGLAPLLAGEAGAAEAVRAEALRISATMIDFPQEDYSTLERIRVTGGVVPDDCWPANRERFQAAVDWTARLGVGHLTMHLGFIDMHDPRHAETMLARTRDLADLAGARDVRLLLETGQEDAAELRSFLQAIERPNVGVNFDPANMILYGKGDPVAAVAQLGDWIQHVHIKDAVATDTPGTWGSEVPWGQGQVGGPAFLDALAATGFRGTVAVEREGGDDRPGDIERALTLLTGCKPGA